MDSEKGGNKETELTNHELRRKTIKSLIVFGVGAIAVSSGIKWLADSAEEDEIPWPLRKQLEANGKIAQKYFSHQHLAPTYPKSKAVTTPRVNGMLGLESPLSIQEWKLIIRDEKGRAVATTMDHLLKMPKTEIIFEFKCIEGWSEISHWGGVKISDFLNDDRIQNFTGSQNFNFLGLETPDKEYYVGMDMESALHPQTLLCYEMNGQPLEESHGAPLRLLVPVKYGIKSIKRIGTMTLTNDRPKDYWAERGYDYHSGL